MHTANQLTAQELLAYGSLVVVPSDAGAQQLRHRHDQQQRATGKAVWSPANVFSWEQWLRSLWAQTLTDGVEDRLLLNAAQEHRLWSQIVQSRGSETLTSPDALAELAQAAWRLSESYGATSRLRQAATTHDARIFAEWATAFAKTCDAQGFISRAGLEAALQARISKRELQTTQTVTVAGFGNWTPAQRALLNALQNSGATVSEVSQVATAGTSADSFVLEADSEEAELYAVARWTRSFLEQHPANAPAHIAVLVPDLDAIQPSMDSIFRNVLAPELQDIGAAEAVAPYEFSSSEPLSAKPMIAAALDIARLSQAPLSLQSASALLLSPYIAPGAALEQRAQFDACKLQAAQRLRPEISLRSLARDAARSEYAAALTWINSLARFVESSEASDAPRSFGQGTEFIRRLLRAADWSSGVKPTAHEAAVERAWEHALDSVATLDFQGERVPFHDVLTALERQLANTHLASTQRAPVQVLSPADAVGMTFDRVIFARATDAKWPKLPSSNPLVAWSLQSALRMPGTDRAADLQKARSDFAALRDRTSSAVFSYSCSSATGPQRPSALVAELQLPVRLPSDLGIDPPAPLLVVPERFEDDAPLPPLTSEHVHGGAAVLQHQAACGFRAFAEIRLRSASPEVRDLGHDARDRGNVLHDVMQRFWKEVKTQRALRAMTNAEQQAVLSRCIEDAFSHRPQGEGSWDAAYLRLQKLRLARLLKHWLASELERTDFEVSEAEEKKTVRVGPLDLTLRVDRIDRVEDGEFLVDYKTGSSASPADWEGERPDEPQLPLYALLERDQPLAGVAFAKVRPGKGMEWKGYATQAGVIPGRNIVRDLPALQEQWKVQLEALAYSFAEGDISVAPKSYPVTCSYCSQRLLCRLDAATLLDTEDPLEPTEEEASA